MALELIGGFAGNTNVDNSAGYFGCYANETAVAGNNVTLAVTDEYTPNPFITLENNALTINETGIYSVLSELIWNGSTWTPTYIRLHLAVDSEDPDTGNYITAHTTVWQPTAVPTHCNAVRRFAAGDVLAFRVWHGAEPSPPNASLTVGGVEISILRLS